MKRRQIKNLLKLERSIDSELSYIYAQCMCESFPMLDNKQLPIPSKQKMIRHVQKRFLEQNPELINCKIASSIISKYVCKKYEVIK